MDNQLAPNKTGNQYGRLDPSSTGFDQMAGNPNMMGMAPQMYPGQNGMAFQGAQMPMQGMGAYINPQTFAPSQAVFAQMQAAKTAAAAASNG